MKDKKVHKAWKVIAIVLIILNLLFLLFYIIGTQSIKQEERQTSICYYDVCKDYPDASYDPETQVCDCYDYDVFGDLVYATSEYMGRR